MVVISYGTLRVHHNPSMEKGGTIQWNFLSRKKMDKIKNNADYQSVMAKIDGLLTKGVLKKPDHG